MENSLVIPIHKWTHDGVEVLILKCVNIDGTSYGGFRWPFVVGSVVEAPDWNDELKCGGGLHGWPWGLSIGTGKKPSWFGAWLVFGVLPVDVCNISLGKVKARRGIIRYVGDWGSALSFVLPGQIAWIQSVCGGAASATGSRGAVSATGSRDAVSATGCRGAASATGDYGAASATGIGGAASATGSSSIAVVTGSNGKVMAGPFSALALTWKNPVTNQREVKIAEIGIGDGTDGKLMANRWYQLDATTGVFMEKV